MRQSQIAHCTIYGSDTIVTQVLTPVVLSLGSQPDLFPTYDHLSSVYVSTFDFLSKYRNNLQLVFVEAVLNFIVFYLRFVDFIF